MVLTHTNQRLTSNTSHVLVIGGGGFIGRQVVKCLSSHGYDVTAIGREPTWMDGLGSTKWIPMRLPDNGFPSLLRELKPWLIFNAASSSSVPLSMTDPHADFMSSPALVSYLLDVVRLECPLSRVMICSSAAVYGSPISLPINEDAQVQPISPYGFHKHMAECLMEQYARIYGLKTNSLRIFSAYGQGLKRQLLWDICKQIAQNGSVSLSGTGRETRDFIHVEDVALAAVAIAEHGNFAGERINVASGTETTIGHIAQLLCSTMNISAIKYSGAVRPGDPLHWRADIGALRGMGFNSSIDLDHGVITYAQWAMEQFHK